MDTWGMNHLNAWLRHEFTDEIADAIRPAMIATFNDDPEFWRNQCYWALCDAARNGRNK